MRRVKNHWTIRRNARVAPALAAVLVAASVAGIPGTAHATSVNPTSGGAAIEDAAPAALDLSALALPDEIAAGDSIGLTIRVQYGADEPFEETTSQAVAALRKIMQAKLVGTWSVPGEAPIVDVPFGTNVTIPGAWVGKPVTVHARPTVEGYSGEKSVVSADVVGPGEHPVTYVRLEGRPVVGEKLYVVPLFTDRGWAESTKTYEWKVDGELRSTATEYVPTQADVGRRIAVVVTLTHPHYRTTRLVESGYSVEEPWIPPHDVVEEAYVPLVPKVSVPKRVRKGKKIVVRFSGLNPGEVVRVTSNRHVVSKDGFRKAKKNGTVVVKLKPVKLKPGQRTRKVRLSFRMDGKQFKRTVVVHR